MNKKIDINQVFEEILSEINHDERDEAALLQAIALTENNDSDKIRANYLRIRAQKIIDQKEEERKNKKIDEQKRKKIIFLSIYIIIINLILFTFFILIF